MTSLTIRRLDEDVKQRLRVRAAREGISMEEAARRILAQELGMRRGLESIPLAPHGQRVPGNIVDAIFAIVEPIGGVEFPVAVVEDDAPFEFSDPDGQR